MGSAGLIKPQITDMSALFLSQQCHEEIELLNAADEEVREMEVEVNHSMRLLGLVWAAAEVDRCTRISPYRRKPQTDPRSY